MLIFDSHTGELKGEFPLFGSLEWDSISWSPDKDAVAILVSSRGNGGSGTELIHVSLRDVPSVVERRDAHLGCPRSIVWKEGRPKGVTEK